MVYLYADVPFPHPFQQPGFGITDKAEEGAGGGEGEEEDALDSMFAAKKKKKKDKKGEWVMGFERVIEWLWVDGCVGGGFG